MKSIFTKAKTKILALLTALLMLPCVFMFSACSLGKGSGDPKPQNQDTALMQALEGLDNYTANIDASYTIAQRIFEDNQGSATQSMSQNFNDIQLKVAGSDYALTNVAGMEAYVKDGVAIIKNADNEWTINSYPFVGALSELANIVGAEGLVQALIDLAPYMGQDCYSVVKTDNGKDYVFNIDLTNLYHEITDLIKNYGNQSMNVFINKFVEIVTDKEFDVVKFINSIKHNITKDTTIEDLFVLFEEKTGFDLLPVAKVAFDFYKGTLTTEENQFTSMTTEQLLDLKLFDLLGVNKITFNLEIDKFIVTALMNSNFINDVIYENEYFDVLEFILFNNINNIAFDVTMSLDKNNNLTNVKVDAVGNIDTLYDEYNEDYDEYVNYSANASLNMTFSNVGETTITVPSYQANYADIYLVVDAEEFVNNNYKIVLNEKIKLGSFEDYYGDVVYTKNNRTLTFSEELAEQILMDDCEYYIHEYDEDNYEWMYDICIQFI